MKVEILQYPDDLKDVLMTETLLCRPDIAIVKSGNLSSRDYHRLIRRFLRDRDTLLMHVNIYFRISIPLFIFNELKDSVSVFKRYGYKLDTECLSYDIDSSLTDKQRSYLAGLFKKVLTLDLSEDQMIYFLPNSVLVDTSPIFTILQLFEFFEYAHKYKVDKQILKLSENMFAIVSDMMPDMFNKENLDIFLASKVS